MPVQTTTHLNFRGDARQALEFYQSVFGGHLVVNTYADFGMPAEIPGSDKVVFGWSPPRTASASWATTSPARPRVASPAAAPPAARTTRRSPTGVFVSISSPTLDELRGYWDSMAVNATIVEPSRHRRGARDSGC